jgi:hypothetical protein
MSSVNSIFSNLVSDDQKKKKKLVVSSFFLAKVNNLKKGEMKKIKRGAGEVGQNRGDLPLKKGTWTA